ncbi:DUF817 domain-containing protein [Herbidospora cretacea]|uniref:DUF817 domain-containing protein n=1 Tax=Herbidospora cretacea TaxID=28444 RepID=UPI000773F616|nr:DUF817 domain-containing protein [Herbidospora cretacea]
MRFLVAQLFRFAWAEVRACAFAGALFGGLAVSAVAPLPVPRYDALLVYAVTLTVVFRVLRWETETGTIAGFHLVGLVFEIVKVRLGSWSYPEEAYTKVLGVPLYSGFLYAAVGGYVCAAWRILALRVVNYRAVPLTFVAVAVYVNFVTHHWWVDLRVPLAILLVIVTWGTTVHFTVGVHRHRMPLSLGFFLTGFFLWLAENIATYFGAWVYPHQREAWRLVHADKIGAWALLVSVTFVIVAAVKGRQRLV